MNKGKSRIELTNPIWGFRKIPYVQDNFLVLFVEWVEAFLGKTINFKYMTFCYQLKFLRGNLFQKDEFQMDVNDFGYDIVNGVTWGYGSYEIKGVRMVNF